MAQTLQISTEQLQKLVEAVRVAATSSATASAAASAALVKPKANFAHCKERFHGSRNYDTVEEFLTNITLYKDVEGISDEDAFKSVSIMFEYDAAIWWQGVRKEAKNFNDVIRLVREHFLPIRPYSHVYLEIFSKPQIHNQPIDKFVCEKRALLAQLPNGRHDEETELDLLYGLLNVRYRKYISRNDVKTFVELLEKGRIVESNSGRRK